MSLARIVRLAGAAGMAAAVLTGAGCAPAPRTVPGNPAPVTPLPSRSSSPGPASPTPVASPTGDPVLPAAYDTLTLSRAGTVVRLPVPRGWSRQQTSRGVELGDQSGTVLLRVEVAPRTAPTAEAAWEALEPTTRRQLGGYRRLDIAAVPGPGDSAADWTFTFVRDGERRRVIDRGIVAGAAGIAVYFSSRERDYERLLPVWARATGGLVLG